MSDSVLEDSFTEFVNYCQMKPYSMNIENIYDLKYLGKRWIVEGIREDYEIMKSNLTDVDLALSKVLSFARIGRKYNKLITPVAQNFLHYVDTHEIQSIPVNIMTEIIRNSSFNIPQPLLFDILVSRFDNDETFAKIFQYLSPDDLTVDNLLWIKLHSDKIDTSFIPASILNATESIRDEVAAQEQFVQTYADSIRQKQAKLASMETSLDNAEHRLKEAKNAPVVEKEADFSALLELISQEEERLAQMEDTVSEQTDDIMDVEGRADDIQYELGQALELIQKKLVRK